MRILPFEKFQIRTLLSEFEIRERLSENLEPEEIIRFNWSTSNRKTFEGEIVKNQFRISRIIYYRNSFQPVIFGRIEDLGAFREIHIRMRMAMAVMIFMCVWLGMAGGIAILVFIAGLSTKSIIAALIPTGFFAFGYILMMGGYLAESTYSKAVLSKLFEEEHIL